MIKKIKLTINIFIMFFLIFCVFFNFLTMKTNYEVNRIKTNKKVVIISFDDGPNYYDDNIMDVLEKYDAKAAFFGTGLNYEKYFSSKQEDEKLKLTIKRMIKQGHSLGNHSYNHQKYQFNTKQAYKEFKDTSNLILKIYKDNGIVNKKISDIPVRMPFLQYYRGMGYLQNKLNIKYFVRGYLGCDYDEAACGKEKILNQYQSNLIKGQIFVAHTRAYAIKWLPDFLEYLKKSNYKTVNFRSEIHTFSYRNYGELIY